MRNRIRYKAVIVLWFFILEAGSGSIAKGQMQNPLQHAVTVVNIAVPTRVYDGDRFVDNLTAADFEVFENGVPQKVEAAYLMRKTNVLQNAYVEGASAPVAIPVEKPDDSLRRRHFILIFEMDEYLPQMTKALDFFFSDVLSQNDGVRVVTPTASWEIPPRPLDRSVRTAMAEDVKARVRKSLTMAGARVRSLIRDLRFNEGAADLAYIRARMIIDELVLMKEMNVRNYRAFAASLKPLTGQKYVFIFYQRESYVIPAEYKSIFEGEAAKRSNYVNAEEIKKVFADAGTTAYFLYLTKISGATNDVEYRESGEAALAEMSGDFLAAFRDLADATGGISEATANPIFGFKKAVEASENYYVLYYRPTEYKADGKYKEIEVVVKGRRYRVTHRAGYIDK